MTATLQAHAFLHLHPARRTPAVTAGVAMVGLAFAVVAFRWHAAWLIGAASGWLLWLAGAIMLGLALVTFTGRLRILGVVASLLAVGLGVYLLLNPGAGALATAILLAAALVIEGSFQLTAALHLRPLAAWRWFLAAAAVSLVAAALVATGLPTRTPDAVAVVLGAALLATGLALTATGLARAPQG